MDKKNISSDKEFPPVVTEIIKEKDNVSSFWELIKFAILAIIIVVPIRAYVAQPFFVSGSSMVPTFQNGQYLIVDEISYRFREPKRDEVIVFKYPKDTTKFFIKRIIGLPGETVIIQGNKVAIKNNEFPNGFTLDEPFVKNESSNDLTVTLKNDEYFVMGDNRIASSDSRAWGTLPKNLIVGRTLVRLLPIGSAAILPGSFNPAS